MAAVTVFLEAYDDSPDYDVLNRIICQWRRVEDQTREQCDLPSVDSYYPGCFYYQRGQGGDTTSPAHKEAESGRRILRNPGKRNRKALSAHDIIIQNHIRRAKAENSTSFKPKTIRMDSSDFEAADPEFDWDEFIASVYEREQASQERRRMFEYQHAGPWFNYFPMIGVKTEYYYRYSGTQTIPPCYGRFTPGSNRGFTVSYISR